MVSIGEETMSKIIPEQLVKTCLACPYNRIKYTDSDRQNWHYDCWGNKDLHQVDHADLGKFPDWCPLEDAPEGEEKL